MASQEELDRRERECEMLVAFLDEQRLDDQFLFRAETIAAREQSLMDRYQETVRQQEVRLNQVNRELTAVRNGAEGPLDLDALKRRSAMIGEARLEQLCGLVLGADGNLNRLRSLGPGSRDLLLNAEKDALERHIHGLNRAGRDLQDANTRLSTENTDLQAQVEALRVEKNDLEGDIAELRSLVDKTVRGEQALRANAEDARRAAEADARQKDQEIQNKAREVREGAAALLRSEVRIIGLRQMNRRAKQGLRETTREIITKDQEIRAKDQMIQEKRQDILSKDQEIQNKDQTIQEKDENITDSSHELLYWKELTDQKSDNIQEKEEKIRQNEETIRLRDARIKVLEDEAALTSRLYEGSNAFASTLQGSNAKIQKQMESATAFRRSVEAEIESLKESRKDISDDLHRAEGLISSTKLELSAMADRKSALEEEIEEAKGVASMLAGLSSLLLSQDEASVWLNLESWALFVQAARDGARAPSRPCEPAWTMLPTWTLGGVEDGEEEETDLIGTLCRLYEESMLETPGAPLALLRRLARKLGTASELPLDAIALVFSRFVDGLEKEEGRPADVLAWQTSAFALLQVARLTRGRSVSAHPGLEAVEARAKTLALRSGTATAWLVEMIDEGRLAEYVSEGYDGPTTARSPKAAYFPEVGLGLVRLPESDPMFWILSPGERTVRAVHGELGRWDGTTKRYRIAAPGEDADVVLQCPEMPKRKWLLENIHTLWG